MGIGSKTAYPLGSKTRFVLRELRENRGEWYTSVEVAILLKNSDVMEDTDAARKFEDRREPTDDLYHKINTGYKIVAHDKLWEYARNGLLEKRESDSKHHNTEYRLPPALAVWVGSVFQLAVDQRNATTEPMDLALTEDPGRPDQRIEMWHPERFGDYRGCIRNLEGE